METNKIVTLEIDADTLETLGKLISVAMSSEETMELASKVLPLSVALQIAHEVSKPNNVAKATRKLPLKHEIQYLKNVVERQQWRISGLMINQMLAEQTSKLAGANLGAALGNLMWDPAPAPLHCTSGGSGEDFVVKAANIYAIEAHRKTKKIYLIKPIQPVIGGKYRHFIETDSDLDDLLRQLQGNSNLLFRVHKSYAINILEYTLPIPGTFCINETPSDIIYSTILKVKTDIKFDAIEYQRQVMRIGEYYDSLSNYARNVKNIRRLLELQGYFDKKYGTGANTD